MLDRALSTAIRVAPTDLSILITGESGVGKEVFSKIIHGLSPRKHNNFIAINTGAIPAGTINSELFGHEKGAFTGATSERKGYFETVDTGTIFLDEIGEMPADTQAFLLRVLENGEYMRVGSSKIHKTDVRVIAATNKDLLERVRNNKFRDDLYYRLNTVPIHIPALRERKEDIYMLFRRFSIDFAEKYRTPIIQLDPEAKTLLENYGWPGNIRELRNVAEQLAVLSEREMISAEDLVKLIPDIRQRHLPAIREDGTGDQFAEREILYKLLFDMKADLNDLNGLIFEMVRSNNLRIPSQALRKLSSPSNNMESVRESSYEESYIDQREDLKEEDSTIILTGEDQHYDESEVVEESLSIEAMEKELIAKALEKHKGRRKEAARDLGISERTLYRKIKQYEFEI